MTIAPLFRRSCWAYIEVRALIAYAALAESMPCRMVLYDNRVFARTTKKVFACVNVPSILVFDGLPPSVSHFGAIYRIWFDD